MRFPVVAGLVLALAMGAGCAGGDEVASRGGGAVAAFCDVEGARACRNDDACGAGETCSEGCCLPACADASSCDPAGCGALGCVCDDGACRSRVCSADAECPADAICAAGACVAPPEEAAIASCVVAPRWAPIRAGMEIALAVQAFDADGRPLPGARGFRFASAAPARAEVDGSGVVRGGTEPGLVAIEVRAGAARCVAEVWSHGPAPDGRLRVVAIDELTGLPVKGAIVQIEGAGGPLAASTAADGAASFDVGALPPAPRTISAFHDAFAWLTVVDTGADDLLLPLRRTVEADRAGGVRGVFGPDELFHPDLVHAGIAGTSIPGNPIDLSLEILVGPARRTRVTIGNTRDVDIPSGVVLGMGNTWFKQTFHALGVPGVCADREDAAAAGCGIRAAWGIAGGVPLIDLPIDEITEGGVGAGELLARLLPHFQRFRSAVVRDVPFALHRGGADAPAWERFAPHDLQATQRMALRAEVRVPSLPARGEEAMDGVVIFGGADVPDRGLVPLGITAGADEDGDGAVDAPGGSLPLRFAPMHGGIEGSDYVVLALAADFSSLAGEDAACTAADRRGCTALAGLLHRAEAFPWGATVDFGGAGFLAPAVDAAWFSGERRFTPGAVPAGADVLRLRLDAGGGRLWHVWMPAAAGDRFLPAPPGPEDRAAGAGASVQALRLAATLDDLFAFGGARAAGAGLAAFSSIDLPR